EGFDDERFDSKDLREWLRSHGTDKSLLDSQIVTGLYNASFCYPEGNFDRPSLSAGVSLRTLFLMGFTSKGAFMLKMQSSMADAVLAPIYKALVGGGEEADERMGRKGSVTFEFFHRVDKLTVSRHGTGKPTIETIEMSEQAITKDGAYKPLIDVRGLPTWPGE